MPFPFEHLIVYQKAQTFIDQIEQLLENELTKIAPSAKDQLSRAALSIALNIAEGNGRWHRAEKRQFFWVARGSTFECVAILQSLYRRRKLDEARYRVLYQDLEELGKMLTNLVKSVERLDAKRLANESHDSAKKGAALR